MGVNEGGIRASLSIDLAAFQADVNKALAISEKLGAGLRGIPTVTPRLPAEHLQRDSAQADAALRVLLSQLHVIPGAGALAQSALLGVSKSGVDMGVALGGGAAAAIVALTGAIVASSKAAIELEKNIAAVKSIKLDLNTKDAAESIRALSAEVGQSSASLAKSLYDIFSSINVSQVDAIRLLTEFSKGSVAAGTDAKTFGTAIVGALLAFGKATDDASHFADVFFNTVKLGVVTGSELAQNLGPLSQAAKQAGLSFEELGAVIVGVTKEGGSAAENTTALTNALLHLNTKESTQQFAALGITLEDSTGKMRPIIAVLTDLKAKLDGMTEAAKTTALQEIFPEIRARRGVAILLSQLDTINTALDENINHTGAAAEAYKTMAETSAAALDRLKESVAAVASEVGDTFTPAIADAANGWARALALIRNDIQVTRDRLKEAGIGFTPPAPNTPGVAQTAATAVGGEVGRQAAFAPRAAEVGGAAAGETEFEKLNIQATAAVLKLRELGADAPQQFFDAFHKSLAEQNPKLAQDFGALVGTTASQLAGLWATATGPTIAAEAALVDQMIETARRLLPNMGEAFYNALRENVIAKAQAAFDGAGNIVESFAEKLSKGLTTAAEIAAQVLQKKLNLDTILANPNASEAAIASLFAYRKELGDVEAAIKNLSDRGLAAHLQALLNQVALTDDAAERQRVYTEVLETSRAALDAQAKGAAAATASATALAKPYDDLASSILPALTSQQQAHIAVTKATEGSMAALAEAAKLAGVDIAQYGDLTQLTGQQIAEMKQEVAAAVKGFAEFLKEEDKSRITGVLGALASGTNDVVAAQAKQLEASGQTEKALALLTSQYGVSAEQAQAWATALKAGGPAAELAKIAMQGLTAATGEAGVALFKAREQLAALSTFARDPNTGVVRLKVDIDLDSARKAIGDLQREFQEANTKRAETESKATRAFSEEQSTASQARSQLTADYQTSLTAISKARTDSAAQLGRDIQGVVNTQNDALSKIGRAREDAAADFRKTVDDTQDKLFQTAADLGKKFGEGVTGLAERAQQAMESFASAQSSALKALSSAMSSFNAQQVSNAFDASVALQEAQNKNLTDTGVFGTVSNQDRIKQIQEAGRAALAQTGQQDALSKAQNSVAQQQIDATKALDKSMIDLSKDMQKLRETFAEGLFKAQEAADKADRDAIDKLEKSNRDTAIAEEQTNTKARDAIREDQRKASEEQKALDEKERAETAKFFAARIAEGIERAQDPERKFRTKAEVAFDEAEKARRKEQRDADKEYQERLHLLRVQEGILEELQGLRADEAKKKPGNVVTIGGDNKIIETSKDLLQKAAQVAQQRLRV